MNIKIAINNQLKYCSPGYRSYLVDGRFENDIKDITREIQQPEQMIAVENVVFLHLIGLRDPDGLIEDLYDQLSDIDLASNIANKVAKKILNEHAENLLQVIEKSTQETKAIEDSVPIPKPPQFVSPKAQSANSRIENIRPKPHQGTGDPYREIPE